MGKGKGKVFCTLCWRHVSASGLVWVPGAFHCKKKWQKVLNLHQQQDSPALVSSTRASWSVLKPDFKEKIKDFMGTVYLRGLPWVPALLLPVGGGSCKLAGLHRSSLL